MKKVLAVLAILLCACSSPASEKTALTLSPSIDRGLLRIEGTTNLPDSTPLAFEVRHSDLSFLQGTQEGRTVIANGRFREDVDLSSWPAGDLEVWIAYMPESPSRVEALKRIPLVK